MKVENFKIEEIKSGIRNGDFTVTKFLSATYEKIKLEDKKISAFLHLTEDKAFKKAKEIDTLKDLPPLAGVPIAIKDNILIKDTKTTGASKILEHFRAPYSATVIEKIEKAGAIVVGKGNMDEFAMGVSTENSAFFPTKNPIDRTKVPGGSSGGPAAAVAARMVPVALGSDTGGSIRQPASFCGIVGFKPSYGRVSRYGLMAMASSLDQIGPLTRSVQDAKIIFDVIKGKDWKDPTSLTVEEKKEFKDSFKLGIPEEYFVDGVEKEVIETIEKTIEKISQKKIEIQKINLPHTQYALACYHIMMACEVSANMARYDGIRYGLEINRPKVKDIKEAYFKNRGLFGNEVKRRIILGTFALSSGYYEAYYMQAGKVRELIKKDFEKAFTKVDAIITPTSPMLPFGIGEKIKDPLAMYLTDMFTVPANLAGLPAISVPCTKQGLPVGLQIIGERFEDEKVLNIAEKIEKII